jgi:hypothetical protein
MFACDLNLASYFGLAPQKSSNEILSLRRLDCHFRSFQLRAVGVMLDFNFDSLDLFQQLQSFKYASCSLLPVKMLCSSCRHQDQVLFVLRFLRKGILIEFRDLGCFRMRAKTEAQRILQQNVFAAWDLDQSLKIKLITTLLTFSTEWLSR